MHSEMLVNLEHSQSKFRIECHIIVKTRWLTSTNQPTMEYLLVFPHSMLLKLEVWMLIFWTTNSRNLEFNTKNMWYPDQKAQDLLMSTCNQVQIPSLELKLPLIKPEKTSYLLLLLEVKLAHKWHQCRYQQGNNQDSHLYHNLTWEF
jgi:hypothetical protein